MKTHGFTLIELLVSLSLIGILTGVALPASVTLIQQYRLRSAAWELFHTINSVRATAVMRNRRITLANGDGNWQTGATFFEDDNDSGEQDEAETLLKRLPAQQSIQIHGNYWVRDYISYLPDGSAYTTSGAFQVGTLTLCKPGLNRHYTLVISIGGRLRMTSIDQPCPE